MSLSPYKNFVAYLRQYLQDEHKAKKGGKLFEGADEWGLIDMENGKYAQYFDKPIPQQSNGYDCGVFTCNFAECFSAGRDFSFEQDDMPDLRLRIAARVMRGKEDWDL